LEKVDWDFSQGLLDFFGFGRFFPIFFGDALFFPFGFFKGLAEKFRF